MACITLLSDFGLQDASAAVAKGMLMQHAPSLTLVDISHEVTPFETVQAAYLLSAAYKSFEPGTCHLALFDVFSTPPPRLILAVHDRHYFLTADNGLLPVAFGYEPIPAWLCFELTKAHTFSDWLTAAGSIAEQLQAQKPEALTLAPYELKRTAIKPPEDKSAINCQVIYIDRYENVVLNMRREEFETLRNGRPFSLQLMQVEEITELSKSYNDVREGNKLCRFNSNGYLELCINKGKAASLFGLRLNSVHNDIKLVFE